MTLELGQVVGNEARDVDRLDAHTVVVELDGQYAEAIGGRGIDGLMHQERRRWRPDMTQPIAHDIAVTVQMAADDDLHRRAAQAAQKPGARLGID